MNWPSIAIYLAAAGVLAGMVLSLAGRARWFDWAEFLPLLRQAVWFALKSVGSVTILVAAIVALSVNYMLTHRAAEISSLGDLVASLTFVLGGIALLASPVVFIIAIVTYLKESPRGLETVRSQRVHDTGGLARAWQIDAALRDEDGGGPAPVFEE